MNKVFLALLSQRKIKIFTTQNILFKIFCMVTITCLTACGGGGSDSANNNPVKGEIEGTGLNITIAGIAAEGAAIANTAVSLKTLSGVTRTAMTNAQGSYSINNIEDKGPYLIRTTRSNGEFIYSIAHEADIVASTSTITRNLHPFTDLIIRNWFATQSLDINNEFLGTSAISSLPTADIINAIAQEIQSIISLVLNDYQVSNGLNLFSTPFIANSEGFDLFLDNSPVVLIENQINVSVQDLNTNVQNIVINNIPLNTDFTNDNDTIPSTPQNVRAIPASETEIIIVWEASSDDKGVKGYNVYRDGELIANTPYPVFIDQNLMNGIDYTYTVEAIDGREQVSIASSEPATATIAEPDTIAPPAAIALTLIENASSNSLTWNQSDIADVFRFEILRGNSGNVTTVIANVTANSFVDFSLVAGANYCYRIVTIDAAGNQSSPSQEVCTDTTPVSTGPATLAFTNANYSVNESLGSIDINVARMGDIANSVSVDYQTADGTATAGSDYEANTGTLTWDANDNTEKTFSIIISPDTLVEDNETILLSLTNPNNAQLGVMATSTATITDAEPVACVELTPTTISTNTTLSLPCYQVDENIVVTDAATLTIDPGVRLQFAEGRQLGVEADGILNAIGSAENPITFTGEIAAEGFWDGLEIESIATSQMDYTIVEYGGGASFNEANIGLSFGGKLSLKNSIIRNSESYGISFSGEGSQTTEFSNNIITLNALSPVYTPADSVGSLGSDSQYTGNTNDFILLQNAAITTDQTWKNLDIDYRIDSAGISLNAELTLEPGVNLIFPANAQFNIRETGTLKAIGTADNYITMTGLIESPGYWSGLQFTFNNNPNEMDYTIVEYAGSERGNTSANIGVFGENGRLAIRNSILRFSENYGFEFSEGINLEMDNVVSTDNNRPGLINIDDLAKLDANSDFTGNTDDRLAAESGSIDTEQTIKKLNVPYFFMSENSQSINAAVTIEPGVEIQFNINSRLNIRQNGSLTAQGTPEAPILLTGAQAIKGYWSGIQFTFSASTANIIDNAIIEYAGQEDGNTNALVGLFGDDTRATITNTTLRQSLTNGIWLFNAEQGVNNTGNIFADIDEDNVFIDE